jgi:hypothetical protein
MKCLSGHRPAIGIYTRQEPRRRDALPKMQQYVRKSRFQLPLENLAEFLKAVF